MAFGEYATEWETELLRDAFGPQVAEAMFYDADDSEDGFELVVARDAGGSEIGRLTPDDAAWGHDINGIAIGDIPDERGKTVKFFLVVPTDEEDEEWDEEPECEGHESLRGDSMGVTVFCDEGCVR
jgi:hypothetical protein